MYGCTSNDVQSCYCRRRCCRRCLPRERVQILPEVKTRFRTRLCVKRTAFDAELMAPRPHEWRGHSHNTPDSSLSLSPQTRLLICQRHEGRGHTTHSSSFLSVPADTPAHLPALRRAGTLTQHSRLVSLSVPAGTPAHLPASRMAGTLTQHTPPLLSLSPQTRLLICQRHEWRGHSHHLFLFSLLPQGDAA